MKSNRTTVAGTPIGGSLAYELARVGMSGRYGEVMRKKRFVSGTGKSAYHYQYLKDDLASGAKKIIIIQL